MSSQNMVPGIKLFGRKIPAPEGQIPVKPDTGLQIPTESRAAHAYSNTANTGTVQAGDLDTVKPGHRDKARVAPECKEDETNTNDQEQEKTFKKPDKIVPCPRCNSFDTKFCYFNNYNVNQPRHFCKNCHRYWTAGGTMRSVPVGAGRRKNKQFSSPQYRQAVLSANGMVPPSPRLESPDSANHRILSPSEFASPLSFSPPEGRGSGVFKFGPKATMSESMDSALNLRGHCRSSERGAVTLSESREEPSSASELESNSSGSGDSNRNQPQQIPALFFPYDSGWQNLVPPPGAYSDHFSSKQPCGRNSFQWGPPPVVAIPGACPTSIIPVQIIPASYLGCVPLGLLNGCLPVSSSTGRNNGSCSATLGKHSRDGDVGDVERSESSDLVPKTLRIDNPNEASRSPIWTALGIKPHDKISCSKVNGSVERKGSDSGDTANIMEANPAALRRSETFLEST